MHKVKQFWSQVIFREEVLPESVFENKLSQTEIKDGYLNLSNMDIPAYCFQQDDLMKVLMINIGGDAEEPVLFRCHQRKAAGKKGKIYKRQRFWPVGFGLKEWFAKQHIVSGDLILLAVSAKSHYLIFRAIRPTALMMLHDRRSSERRDLERRFDDRRRTLLYVPFERRKRDRRDNERRARERRQKRLMVAQERRNRSVS
jgi:hypothetical protein